MGIILVAIICLILPIVLTIINLLNLFIKKKISEDIFDILTMFLGVVLTIFLYYIMDYPDYYIPRIIGGDLLHAPIASWSMPTILVILAVGVISFFIIKKKKLNLPPIIIVISMSGILLCTIFMILFIIQISKNIKEDFLLIFFYIFPINYIMCSIRRELEVMKYYKENYEEKNYKNKFLNYCNKIVKNVNMWPFFSVIFLMPLMMILVGILVLFGQRPDECIKAFLETSDWTLSKEISPPPIEPEFNGHYLCTVSLKGHKNIVKPTRIGIRNGKKIIVNRQLCVANAFEDLIKEKTPKFHYFIRTIYDKYGYPLSKHIKKSWQADLIYIVMKPLEWIFLITLYLYDVKPENRIALQYIGNKNYLIKKLKNFERIS